MGTDLGLRIHPIFRPLIRYGLLIALSSCCYWPTRTGTFVFDDTVAIVKNQDVTNHKTALRDLFQHDFWGTNLTDPTSHKSYRPLTILSFQKEIQLFGMDATLMKTTNWMLHTGVGLMLPKFFKTINWTRHRNSLNFEYWAAVLFVVHPIHTEAVAGIVGRAELLATFWFVIGVTIYSSLFGASQSHDLLWKHASVFSSVFLCTTISILCKETGITTLAVCAALDILNHINEHNLVKSFLSNRLLQVRIMTLAAMTCILIYGRLWIQDFGRPQFRDKDNPIAISEGLTKVLSQSYLYCLNLWLLLCPDWLSFDWALDSVPLVRTLFDYRVPFVIMFYVFMISLVLRTKIHKPVLMGVALMIIPFLPACGIVRVGFVIAERVLYIPSLGYCYLIAYGFERLSEKVDTRWIRILLRSGFFLICLLFVARTVQRSESWSTEHRLFRSALRVVPKNAKVHYNIARLATDEGDKPTAFVFYKRAIELYPEYEAAHMNLGNLYRDEQNYGMALRHLSKAIEFHQEFHTAWMNLGIVHAAMKNYDEALFCYQRAMRKKKHYPNCMFNLGNLYNDMGNQSQALAAWNETVQQDPQHIKAWNNMVNVYDGANLQKQVLAVTDRALSHLPGNPTLLAAQATALAKMGRYPQAERIYSDLILSYPREEKYHQNMGVLYHRWGKLKQAERLYREALKLNPGSEMARTNLAKLMASRHGRF
ncbi:protein O-mannosyl-transferase TMTC4 [Malaya genurostris]|uniref:protein O-mannosyl-transferase TMTC4 n=1 Tax=Malaya genurostris TaxID=325434 RepID=UPI0026F38566|nr:protein O-mannosyl-transferase TMTC4 [Malaya genurostris]